MYSAMLLINILPSFAHLQFGYFSFGGSTVICVFEKVSAQCISFGCGERAIMLILPLPLVIMS